MKFSKFIAIASAAVLMAACGGNAVEGSKEVRDLLPNKSAVDSVSYLIGVNFGSWIKGNNFTPPPSTRRRAPPISTPTRPRKAGRSPRAVCSTRSSRPAMTSTRPSRTPSGSTTRAPSSTVMSSTRTTTSVSPSTALSRVGRKASSSSVKAVTPNWRSRPTSATASTVPAASSPTASSSST